LPSLDCALPALLSPQQVRQLGEVDRHAPSLFPGAQTLHGPICETVLRRQGTEEGVDSMAKDDEPITGMYELLDAIEVAIKASDPAKREALRETFDAYHDDFPEEFHWALGERSPALLYHLMMTISVACRDDDDEPERRRTVLRLVDRKPEGNA
jgi:hypothetical protein